MATSLISKSKETAELIFFHSLASRTILSNPTGTTRLFYWFQKRRALRYEYYIFQGPRSDFLEVLKLHQPEEAGWNLYNASDELPPKYLFLHVKVDSSNLVTEYVGRFEDNEVVWNYFPRSETNPVIEILIQGGLDLPDPMSFYPYLNHPPGDLLQRLLLQPSRN